MAMLRILILLLCYTTGNVLSWTLHSHKITVNCRQNRTFRMASTGNVAHTSSNDVNHVKILGVCGGIGSGKSAACKLLVSELNCFAHIDSDSIAHTVYEPNSEALKEVVNEFGSDLLLASGEIDRKKLGSIVFADNSAMKKLERIVWPHVKEKIIRKIESLKVEITAQENNNKVPVIIVEAAVLLDAEWNDFLDGIWVVTVSQSNALHRLQNNRNLSVEESSKRIQAQSTRRGIGNLQNEVDNGVVSAVITNDGSLEDLKACLQATLNDPNAWYPKR